VSAVALQPIVRERRFLQPGHMVVSAEPLTVTTILGSCVSVCLWDATRRVGGINHFMLPLAAPSTAGSLRFGDFAMWELVTRVCEVGGRTPFLKARVFGGACMFAPMQTAQHLGAKNADLALEFLHKRGIQVVQTDLGGTQGRKLSFNTDEGSVCLSKI
jgi:chemotaxis protein CheD